MKAVPIVILPGWLLGSTRFTPIASLLRKKGFEVHTIDFPGFEQGQELTRVFNLTDYVRFVEKYLKQKRITKAVFICHSFGGRVALKLLSQSPQKAYGLVLSGTPGFRSVSFRIIAARVVGAVGKILSFVPPFIFFRKQFQTLLYKFAGNSDYIKTSGLTRETFKRIIKEPLVDYMKKLRVPTLLIWGEKDGLVSVRVAKKMQKTIKHSQLVVLPNQRHNVIYKQPEEFANQVMQFIDAL